MESKKLVYALLIVGAVAIGGVGLFTYLSNAGGVGSKRCGMENCHGLDITCGPNIPKFCTEEYMLGDNCRQYAKCEIINGKCQLVKSEKFELCKSCVETCAEDFRDDVMEIFKCESGCYKEGF